ncbi:hypothetical protein [Granulicella sp. S156]|uniref:hypothetical protein n=1 Tax=Granulicella sp. S156 TaxID=1747224 RepID=UPI00131E82F3|nr:hypothetical protein [Granulicella sp. S156]
MLDVHPPHHGISGVRDFFIHLLTITVGLLIALGLEAGVEAAQHRHERKEAEATLREELTQNRVTLVSMEKETNRELDALANVLKFLEDLREGTKGDPKVWDWDFNVEPLQSAGWHTAAATGVLSYMNYGEAQRFSAAYQEQQFFEEAVAKAFSDDELLATYIVKGRDPREMKPPDIESAIGHVRQDMADIRTMSDITRATLTLYDKALK